jgi:RNA polymerase sigma-70 factor (ECF subfamily)
MASLLTTNEKIIEDLLQDDPQAMKRLFELYYVPLCRYALRYTVSIDIAEEIVSDVMYKIWQNRYAGYYADTFREYLYTATHNTTLNYLKQQQNQKTLSDKWAEQIRNEMIENTPLDVLIGDEMQSNLARLMDMLPEQCRKAFIMSRVEDMTYEEIATQMDISVNTVKYHIKTALQKLRAGMGVFIK